MSMQKFSVFAVLILSVFAFLATSVVFESEAVDSQFSAYEILQHYGFPSGLLPKTIQDYNFDATSGRFTLNLAGSCKFTIPDAYPVRYSSRLAGRITSNRISDLRGISVKVFFIWWDIDAISVRGSDLVFKVGPFSASYPATNFSESPECGRRVDELLELVKAAA